ncbi:MAG: hypothetical protein WA634_12810 [Silvibacterium sp.]
MNGDPAQALENTDGNHAGEAEPVTELPVHQELAVTPPEASASGQPTFYIPSTANGQLRQAEILSNVYQHRITPETLNDPNGAELDRIDHLLAIILSQDCDLEQDFKRREAGANLSSLDPKLLPTILLCEVSTDGAIVAAIRSQGDPGRQQFYQNKLERYQFLRAVEARDDALGSGIEAMGIDFKRYFTVPTAELYAQLAGQCRRRCRLAPQYLEHFSMRFSNHLSRIGLPRNHHE